MVTQRQKKERNMTWQARTGMGFIFVMHPGDTDSRTMQVGKAVVSHMLDQSAQSWII